MGDEKVEQVWYALWLIEGIVALSFLWAVALICKRPLRRIRWNRLKRRSVKHTMVHSLGMLQSPPNFDASESIAADLDPGNMKRRVG